MRNIKQNKMRILAGAIAFVMCVCVLNGANFLAKKNIEANVTTQGPTTKAPVVTTKQPTTAPQPTTKKVKPIKLSKPVIKAKKYKKTKVKITWKKVKKAKKYIVYKATNNNFKIVKMTNKKKYIDSKTKRGNTYKYKVVAVTKSHGKTYKSEPSKTKQVKIPKIKHKGARVVICGECFVEGMRLYAKKYLPAKTALVPKIGMSTYAVLNSNTIRYKGKSVTPLERIAYYNPEVVYFLVGMNEARGNTTSIINNYKKIVKLLKSVNKDINVVLLALPPVGRSHDSGFANNSKINKVNRAYKAFAAKTSNVFYYDGYRRLLMDGAGYLKGSASGGDGGHWSSGATIKVVKDLKKHVKQFLN